MSKPKFVFITGANRGIGREVAGQLAARGLHVFLGARDKAEAERAVHEIVRAGGQAAPIQIDISDEASVKAAAQALADTHTAYLDVLINNGAVLLDEGASILDLSVEKLMTTLRTNTAGSLQVAQTFLKFLLRAPEPRLINVSSGAGSLTHMNTWAPAYSISKTALNAVTRQLAASLSGKNVAVNSVCPGWVRTRMGGASAPKSVEQGAETIVWLAADAPHSFTGKFFGDGKRETEW
ncbi:MAG TPA: SDR family NAD(P)-dependent oxidoreductase [Planctomycetota bacterium]|nr:SDR family NAD(P)-dependent oxidoreductase [Planctomycetota bacterium]